MIRKQIIATDEIDRHNQRIPVGTLREMADHISRSESVTRMGIAHDATLLPVGKVMRGELIALDHGVNGLEVQIDDFIDEFQKIAGPDNECLYYAKSEFDTRPFVELCSSAEADFVVSFNPIDFSPVEFQELIQIVEGENGKIETVAKKALNPEIEVLLTLATRVLECLIIKKVLEKTSDKISDDISNSYDKVKKIAKNVFSRIKEKRNVTYILSAPNQPIELIVRCDSIETLSKAIEEKDSGDIAKVYERFSKQINGDIRKIQFVYNVETNKWELNYLTTSKGEVVGTEKCYKRTIKLYKEIMQSPTAGFSIGAPVSFTIEESTEQ